LYNGWKSPNFAYFLIVSDLWKKDLTENCWPRRRPSWLASSGETGTISLSREGKLRRVLRAGLEAEARATALELSALLVGDTRRPAKLACFFNGGGEGKRREEEEEDCVRSEGRRRAEAEAMAMVEEQKS
jgi:hypothetical protein